MGSTNRVSPGAGFCHPSVLPKGPNGRALCRQCGIEVPKGRRTFCSDECVGNWKTKTDPGYVRDRVFARDNGVCAKCGLDTVALKDTLLNLRKGKGIWRTRAGFPGVSRHPVVAMVESLNTGGRQTYWDADHIVPVVEGGGECDLANFRTLCIWCHKAETAVLAKRRAEKRREERSA